jgi:hypothetical protein
MRRLASALTVSALVVAMISCGSRTGLFGPDSELAADASLDGGDAGEDGAVPCKPGRFTFELALTQLMFVIDRSGSMAFSLDGLSGQPPNEIPKPLQRWGILQEALRRTITTFDDQIAMGAKFFPEPVPRGSVDSERSCRTDPGGGIAPARGNANAILRVFDSTEPRGGTPTAEALRLAAQFLTQRRGVAKTLVLATDGAPNCNVNLDDDTCVCTSVADCHSTSNGRYSCLDDARSVATVQNIAGNQKIPVYVIGIGGLEKPQFRQVLDDMAVAGGRARATSPRYYSASSQAELTTALVSIRDSVAKCTYITPSAPQDPNNITVEIDGVVIPRDQTKNDGWDWVDQNFGELAFFGEACAAAQGSGGPPAVVSGTVVCNDE